MRFVKLAFLILLACIGIFGVAHELYMLFAYDLANPTKNSVTKYLYVYQIFFWIIWDRTNLFREGLVSIDTRICRAAVAAFVLMALCLYATLFGAAGLDARIHRFAPFNVILAVLFFVSVLVSVAGQALLGFFNRAATRAT